MRYNKTIAVLLAFFLGGLGVHHFYMGNIIRGVLYLAFCWTFIPSILSFFDIIVIIAKKS